MKKFEFYRPRTALTITTNIPSNYRIFNFFYYFTYPILIIFNFFTFSVDYFCKAVFTLKK